jgi:hypothetical protein
MAQTGFTPIQIYSSSTTGNTPAAGNLLNSSAGSELAINIFDGKLFYKDNAGAVQVIGWKVVPVSAGGTGQTSYTDGQLLIGNSTGNTLTKATLTAGSGVTITNGAGAITINATGSGGTVTSVSGTAPVSVATGTTTPVISLASGYGDTQNPYASKTANYILASPNGSAGVPTFRALVSADIPSLSSIYVPYTGASAAIDLNAQTVVNIAHLGIGTTSVPTILLRAVGDNNSTSRIAVRGYSSNANSSAIRITKFRGTVAAPQAPQSGDSLGKFEFAGYGTTSSEGYPQASFEGLATEAWGATARGAKTVIKVTPNTTTTQVVAVTIDQNSAATFASSVTATSFSGSGASLTSIPNSALVNSTISGVALGGSLFNLTAGTGVSFSAGTTYNGSTAITINATGTGGTVTSVAALTLGTSGTDLSSTVANGTTTPVITLNVPTASAANRGALSAADWTTFNNKGSGSVTSVAASVPSFLSIAGSPITTSGTLAITLSGTALPTTSGGTGLTSFTSGGVVYASSTSALATGTALYFNGTSLGVGTTSPSFKVDVSTSGASNYIRSIGTSNGFRGGFYATAFNSTGVTVNASFQAFGDDGTGTAGLYTVSNHPLYFGTNNAERMRVHASGGVSIGNTTDPGATNLSVTGNALFATTTNPGSGTVTIKGNGSDEVITCVGYSTNGSGTILFYQPAVGKKWGIHTDKDTFYIANAGFTNYAYLPQSFGAWSFGSDRRIKKDIVDLDYGLDLVMKLQPRRYTLIDNEVNTIGFIAQELKKHIPEAVTGEEIDYDDADTPQERAVKTMGIAKETIIPVLVKAIQELKAEIDLLKGTK